MAEKLAGLPGPVPGLVVLGKWVTGQWFQTRSVWCLG